MIIKKLLKKHRYPPEGMEDAVQTVMTQCELWADNEIDEEEPAKVIEYPFNFKAETKKVAEDVEFEGFDKK